MMLNASRSLFNEIRILDGFGLFFGGVRSKIPNFDAIDLEIAVITPSRPPLAFVIIEFRRSSLWCIRPGLGSNSVTEISCSSSNSQVKNEIVGPIEGSIFILRVLPRIWSVSNTWLVPIALRWMINLQYFIGIVIKISIKGILIPIEAVSMEVISKRSTWTWFFSVSFSVLIGKEVRSPMHGRAESFRPSSEFSWVVNISSTLHDIDFTTGRPFPVFVVSWKTPDGWP